MPTLSWRQHTLIQALLSRGPHKETDFKSLFFKVTSKSAANQQSMFNEYLRKINEELAYVQFELRACRNQYDGKVYYGVVNNVSDEQSKLGTKYSVPQIAFYKGVIEAIVQDVASLGCISTIDALNIRLENQFLAGTDSQSQGGSVQIPAAFRNFSMSQKEKTLEELVKDQWLSLTDGKIGLGVRSFLDLRSWFRSNEVPPCEVCNEAAVKAELCQNEGCNVRIHQYCLRMKFSQHKAEKVCPGCGTEWHYNITKAEVVDEEDDASAPDESQQPGEPLMRKRRRTCGATDADTPLTRNRQRTRGGNDSDTVKPGSSQSTRVTRGSARLRSAS
ncbi:uncharacterized protein [Nicotiana sylvestris]|uniref:Non-structural maintenance of chromosomes element 1 homolog n=1 Tax=Nicotiana sylvestris TaxID=4096 RepID=A0A1U7W782_NICSY|nr:PREDICTED: non-structural maintenance of chromosomes element 1 homolog isoform X1 [Nicotiana sylvestris]